MDSGIASAYLVLPKFKWRFPLVILVLHLLPMPSHARAFDVRAHAVFGGDAFESESESPRRTWQVFADDLVDVTQGVILPEESLQETL